LKNILLGITGSIAAYKSADLVSMLLKLGYNVNVVMTKASQKFITPLTLQTLSKNKVYTDIFQEEEPAFVKHISLVAESDILIIAPASANIINKIAVGIADDMLSCIALTMWEKPMIIAPAMHTKMYFNPIVQDNISKLKARACTIIEPKESLLACGDYGKGALADVAVIVEAIVKQLRNTP